MKDKYSLQLMGKNKIEYMYYDSHTTIRKVFLERMNRARNNYLCCSEKARIQFEEYMYIKKHGDEYGKYFKNSFNVAKFEHIKSANEVKHAKRLYKYYQIQYDEVCNRLPNELLNMEIGEYANIHYDDELCYYVGFDETENVDIRPLLMDCYRDAIYNFKNKLLEESKKFNIKEREITNRINVIALEEIMNNLLRL